jgi:predicted PurR-regulated permease PerM
VIAGFLFAPAPRLVDASRSFLLRLVPERSDEFIALAGMTIRSVSQGVIGISVVQAVLAGIGLKLIGIPNAGLLAFLIMASGILQIGAAIFIVPAVIWVWITKDTTAALLFTAYMVPVGLMENVLKPIVMGRGLKTPAVVIFIGVIGGTLEHGIVGLFVGPVVLAVGWSLLAAWFAGSKDSPALADPESAAGGGAIARSPEDATAK